MAAPKFDKRGHFINIGDEKKRYRVTCLNEQISHHPPVSAFHYHCEETGVSAYGIDQIAAKFTGTCKPCEQAIFIWVSVIHNNMYIFKNYFSWLAVKVGPGEQNKGIYINLAKRGNEEYLMTHPVATIQGWLKASLYIVVGECCIVTCPKSKLKAILEYKEEVFNKNGILFDLFTSSFYDYVSLNYITLLYTFIYLEMDWEAKVCSRREDI